MRGVLCFYQGDYRRTVSLNDEAAAILKATATGTQWEYTPWQMWSMIGLAMLGDMRELVRRVTDNRQDAERRADRLAEQNVSLGKSTLAWLALGQPREAIERADRALGWAVASYTAQHYQHYVTTAEADLYLGDAASAWRRTLDTWGAHRKNAFLMLTFMRDDLLQTRAKAALAVAAQMRTENDAAGRAYSRRALRRVALRAAHSMQGHGLPCALGWARLVRASVHHQEGAAGDAAQELRRAVQVFEDGAMALYREASRYALGIVTGGDEGRALLSGAEAWMREQRIAEPRAMARMVVPGIVT
jgi:tetratricopeptide (TPR) repeat protein